MNDTDFHNVTIPDFISPFISVKPIFSTLYAKSLSGREVRKSDTYNNKLQFLISNCRLSEEEFISFQIFFANRSGKRFSFKIKNPLGYKIIGEKLLKLNDYEFQLCTKSIYGENILHITKPISHTVKIYSSPITKTQISFSLDPLKGIVFLDHAMLELYADCEFETEVRFDVDDFDYKILKDGSILISDIELIQIL